MGSKDSLLDAVPPTTQERKPDTPPPQSRGNRTRIPLLTNRSYANGTRGQGAVFGLRRGPSGVRDQRNFQFFVRVWIRPPV